MSNRNWANRSRSGFLLCTALVSVATVGTAAEGQIVAAPAPATTTTPASSPSAAPQTSGIPDIVVTAQRREQRLQDVPIAITAVTQNALEVNRVQTVADLSGLAPNVTVRQAAGGAGIPSFTSRGVVSYGVVPGSDKEFSIYLDGVYIGSTTGSLFDLPDVERIEVLRGPQGTLFGRNSTAGAVSVVTRDPSGVFSGHQDLTMGNYGEFRTRTTLDLPAVGPFSAYLSFVHEERDGDIRNTGGGTTWDRTGPYTHSGLATSPSTLGGKNVESYFGALKFEPGDGDLKMIYKFDHTNAHITPDGEALIGINANAPIVGPVLAGIIAGQTTPVEFDPSGKRPKSVNNSFSVPTIQRVTGHNLTTTLQISDSLNAKNIAAYRTSFLDSANQIDGLGGLTLTPQAFNSYLGLISAQTGLPASLLGLFFGKYQGDRFVGIVDETQSRSKQYSDEQQLNYHSHLFDITLGGLFYHESTQSAAQRGLPNNLSFTPLPANGRIPPATTGALGLTPGTVTEATSYNKVTSIAAYAQAEVHVTSKLDLVAGGRVTRDHKSGTYVSNGNYVAGADGGYSDGTFTGEVFSPFEYHKTKPTYSIGLNYKPTRDILLYGKYSTGFVSGGAISSFSFKPETVRSAEIGAKTEFLERRVIANIALFHANYDNLQSAQSGTSVPGAADLGTVIVNQGNLRAQGAEFELNLAPVRAVTLGGSLGYTDAKLGAVNPLLLAGQGVLPGGKYLPTFIPKFTSSMYAQYQSQPVWGAAYLLARVDAQWRSRERLQPNPDTTTEIPSLEGINFSPASWVVNARLAVRDIGPMHAEVGAWVRNLNNNRAVTFAVDLGGIIGAASFQPARTFGLDVGVSF